MADPDAAPLPPQNLDAEESVLGAMMLHPTAIDAVVEIVQARDFYRHAHAKIFEAVLRLHDAGRLADAITVADALHEAGELEEAGGKQRLHEIATLVPATTNAAHYARIVRDHAVFRGLTVAGEQIQRLGWDRPAPAADLVERAEELVFDLAQQRSRADLTTSRDALGPTLDRIRDLHERGAEVIGLPTGFEQVDHLTSGMQAGNLIVVAGRPSMGKTALALGIANHAAVHRGVPVAIFTLEMSEEETMQRLLSIEGLLDLGQIRTGRLNTEGWRDLYAAAERISAAPLLVSAGGFLTIGELRSRCRRLKLRRPDLALVVIDYLQLMASTGGRAENRVQEISQISRGLKLLAGDLGVPVLALSQLSRQVEHRHDKRPILSDLRESGSIEQDADVVAFVYREEYYFPEDLEAQGIAEVNIAKQRNGPTGTAKLSFVKRLARFSDLPRS